MYPSTLHSVVCFLGVWQASMSESPYTHRSNGEGFVPLGLLWQPSESLLCPWVLNTGSLETQQVMPCSLWVQPFPDSFHTRWGIHTDIWPCLLSPATALPQGVGFSGRKSGSEATHLVQVHKSSEGDWDPSWLQSLVPSCTNSGFSCFLTGLSRLHAPS